MATNYTDKYQLCQWEAEDQVNRLEFNQDNSRIEGALVELLSKLDEVKGEITGNITAVEGQISALNQNLSQIESSIAEVEGDVSSMNSTLSAVSKIANSAYSTSNPCIELGSYYGNGASTQTISFENEARFVWVFRLSSGEKILDFTALRNTPVYGAENKINHSSATLALYTNSFTVGTTINNNGSIYYYYLLR